MTNLRVIAAVLVTMLVGTVAARSYCPMTSSTGPAATTHDCCKEGLSSPPPACCHGSDSDAVVATLSIPSATPFAATVSHEWLRRSILTSVTVLARTSPLPHHSPPSSVRRS